MVGPSDGEFDGIALGNLVGDILGSDDGFIIDGGKVAIGSLVGVIVG